MGMDCLMTVYRKGKESNYWVRLNSGTPYNASTKRGGFQALEDWGTGLGESISQVSSGILGTNFMAKRDVIKSLFDINGDGVIDDVIRSGPFRRGDYEVRLNPGGKSHLLTTVTLPTGGTIDFEYRPASQFDNSYVIIETGKSKQRLPFPMWVVTKVITEDKITKVTSDDLIDQFQRVETGYIYRGGYYYSHLGEQESEREIYKEFRGFREVVEKDPSGAYTINRFFQDDDRWGNIKLIERYAADKKLIHREEYTYRTTDFSSLGDRWQGKFVFLENETSTLFDGSLQFLFEIEPVGSDEIESLDQGIISSSLVSKWEFSAEIGGSRKI